MRRRAGAVLLGALLATALGCGGPAQLRYEQRVERAPEEVRHALHDERLRELMRGLERLRDERLPQAMDLEGEERRRRVEIARVARALSHAAVRLEASAPDAALNGDSRREFLGLAAALGARTRALADEADTVTIAAVASRLRDIDDTCDACHTRFRVPGGLRDPR